MLRPSITASKTPPIAPDLNAAFACSQRIRCEFHVFTQNSVLTTVHSSFENNLQTIQHARADIPLFYECIDKVKDTEPWKTRKRVETRDQGFHAFWCCQLFNSVSDKGCRAWVRVRVQSERAAALVPHNFHSIAGSEGCGVPLL
jgi:hypothetical protein